MYFSLEMAERFKPFIDMRFGMPPEPGSIHFGDDRRGFAAECGVPWEKYNPFYPLTSEEARWAENAWGPQHPRWFIQEHGSGINKRHSRWDQIRRLVESLPGQVIWLDDELMHRISVPHGLALAATADRFVGFDSAPFWAAIGGGAEALALFPALPPDKLYWPIPEPRTFPIWAPGASEKVPVQDIARFILEFWGDKLPAGMRPLANADGLCFIGTNSHDHLSDTHEQFLEPVMFEGLTETSVVVDVGMHVGTWTFKFAKRVARVYAVEPSYGPRTSAQMTASVRGIRNIVFHACALADKRGQTTLQEDFGGTRIEGTGGETVPVCTFDDLFKSLNRLDFVKIDTEGAEAMILRGARETIAKLRPRMLIEVHQFAAGVFDADPYRAISDELAFLGYHSKRVSGHDENFYIEATPPRR